MLSISPLESGQKADTGVERTSKSKTSTYSKKGKTSKPEIKEVIESFDSLYIFFFLHLMPIN